MSGAGGAVSINSSSATGASGVMPPTAAPGLKKCFNKDCGDVECRRGWRLLSGEYASLCDRCALAYEDGKFCETFHLNASGWRSCESCGRRVHCGCIVSIHLFTFLDAGGIECLDCAKKKLVLKSTKGWPAGGSYHLPVAQTSKDLSETNWSHFSSNEVIIPWYQAPRTVHDLAKPSNKEKDDVFERLKIGNPPVQDSLANGLSEVNNCSASMPSLHNKKKMRNGRIEAEAHCKKKMLSISWPRSTNHEPHHIAGNSNSMITPLFEKMLSASDAGRIGRLVLPKKCAEAYFPPISQPEGLPLKVQDSNGIEWTFQFRYWPNNNSRMYVLEGVTPCIQSMQLQAGDIVTFSRLDPDSKLIMGYRKASGKLLNDKVDFPSSKTTSKKKNTIGLKNKRLRIDDDDMAELKSLWEESQRILQPPPNCLPSIVVIQGFEFEEYEDAPVLGKHTVFKTDKLGSEEELRILHFHPVVSKEVNWVDNLDGLDTLANLAASREDDNEFSSYSQSTTSRHLRRKHGCSCIVCIQPPSGKSFRHRDQCPCNDFKTSENDVDASSSSVTENSSPKKVTPGTECSDDVHVRSTSIQIDLNMQPELEE